MNLTTKHQDLILLGLYTTVPYIRNVRRKRCLYFLGKPYLNTSIHTLTQLHTHAFTHSRNYTLTQSRMRAMQQARKAVLTPILPFARFPKKKVKNQKRITYPEQSIHTHK